METLSLMQRGNFTGVVCKFRTLPKTAKLYGYDYLNESGLFGCPIAIYYTIGKKGLKYFLIHCQN